MPAQPIQTAAGELGISPATLRRWIGSGCPVAQRGRRGRSCMTLIDVDAVKAWRRAGSGEDALIAFAARVPELLADAVAESHRLTTGPHKQAAAGVLAATWYICASAMLDSLREQVPAIPELVTVPEHIERLRKIATK